MTKLAEALESVMVDLDEGVSIRKARQRATDKFAADPRGRKEVLEAVDLFLVAAGKHRSAE